MSSKLIEKIFEILDKNVDSFNKNYQERKNKFKKWITNEFDFQLPNWLKVFVAGIISFFIFRYFYEVFINLDGEIKKIASFWTLASLIISSPVAFIIWYFRDQNATQQIENQRKDINLKEFQKIAEWVSGQHLTEYEVTEKAILEDGKKDKFVEKTKKYGMQNTGQSIPTFSKSDGAVGLQIAAIYSLLPFFRGEHGESFRRPALNLLTSAWLSLQQKELLVLEKLDVLTQKEEFDSQIENIQKRATSPIGIALTQVLLSDGGDNLLKFPEVFPNLCLAGMDFHLPGLDKKVLGLFHRAKKCLGFNLVGINLVGANLYKANLNETNLIGCTLNGTVLSSADLTGAYFLCSDLICANLKYANLDNAYLNEVDLTLSKLNNANLEYAILIEVSLKNAELNYANLESADLIEVDFNYSNLENVNLIDVDLSYSNFIAANLIGSELVNIFLFENDFDGTIIDGDPERALEIRKQGAVLLYKNKRDFYNGKKYKIFLEKESKTYIHQINFDIDLDKTQQENPDWQISLLEDIY